MKTVMKKILALLLCLCLVGQLAGCQVAKNLVKDFVNIVQGDADEDDRASRHEEEEDEEEKEDGDIAEDMPPIEAPAVDDVPADAPPVEPPIKEELVFAYIPFSDEAPYAAAKADAFVAACDNIGVTPVVVYLDEHFSLEAQFAAVESMIASGVNGIVIEPIDVTLLEPLLMMARDCGISVIDCEYDSGGAELYINMTGRELVAQTMVDAIYDLTGGAGEFAVLSASSIAPVQIGYLETMQQILASDPKYADLVWVETIYSEYMPEMIQFATEDLLQKSPNIECICSLDPMAIGFSANAVMAAGSSAKVTGLALPSEIQGYLSDPSGVCPYAFYVDLHKLGEAAAYTLFALATGQLTGEVGESFTAANGVTYKVQPADDLMAILNEQIYSGGLMKLTRDNVSDWVGIN